MFTLIENKKEIKQAHKDLACTIEKHFDRSEVKDIGYPGGTEYSAKVNTDGNYWFWSGNIKNDTSNPRRLNWFGAFNEHKNLQIAVEINTPYSGTSGKVAGFFARHNKSGRVYLFHSGRVGGGTKGVGKTSFLAWSNHDLVSISDKNGDCRQGVIVMPIDANGSVQSVIRYIDSIISFKEAVRAGDLENPEFKKRVKQYNDFYSEPSGHRAGKRKNKIDYISRHGDVVDALYEWRNNKGLSIKCRIVKNVQIDMAVEEGDDVLAEVYEVKTNAGRTDVYTALGQLMIHSSQNNCKKIIVLPTPVNLPADINNALERLNIEVIEYDLSETKAWII